MGTASRKNYGGGGGGGGAKFGERHGTCETVSIVNCLDSKLKKKKEISSAPYDLL